MYVSLMSYMEKHRVRVGLRIAAARRAAGFSGQEAFAERVQITRRHLSRIETGRSLPRADLLARIADATGKPESFFESDDDEEAAPVEFGSAIQAMFERAVDQAVDRRLRRAEA